MENPLQAKNTSRNKFGINGRDVFGDDDESIFENSTTKRTSRYIFGLTVLG
ncbi:hypothetical protein [Flavobacterium xanthum]|uniref:hypothetical protein n=1 Tax=Flavobacterium xanthum TaxID=69322 RepID=UPI001587583E|nr:hypothetical protein [Flavobacterium xanthum]